MSSQDFSIVRGDDFLQPFTITLDQDRVLDGTETWTFSVRKDKDDASPKITLTKGGGQITIDAATKQPTVVFDSATPTLTEGNFPSNNEDVPYWYDLQMVKDAKVETVAIGRMIVVSDITR